MVTHNADDFDDNDFLVRFGFSIVRNFIDFHLGHKESYVNNSDVKVREQYEHKSINDPKDCQHLSDMESAISRNNFNDDRNK